MKLIETQSIEFADLDKALKDTYPFAYSEYSENFDLKNSMKLFSPFEIQLPNKFLDKIKKLNVCLNKIYRKKFEDLKENPDLFRNELNIDPTFKYKPLVLSCLDFHIDLEKDEIKLIEANTNSSGYLIGSLVYKIHNMDFKIWADKLLEMFKESDLLNSEKFYVTDEDPERQKMYLEFLLYKDFFKQHQYELEIVDIKDLENKILELLSNKEISIYNRSTDFYLKNYRNILDSYLKQKIELNPNPIGYDLWAHKDNLSTLIKEGRKDLDISEQALLEQMILKSGKIKDLFPDIESAWKERKKYFFKPSESYGGKASYRGSSISKKYFQNLWDQNFLTQEFFAPSKFVDRNEVEWKFDLRVYTFKDSTLFAMARVYKGQITNFSTLGGGFAPVQFY